LGDPAPPKKGHSPLFSAHVDCSQMAEWIKVPLGTKVDLGPGGIVLDGNRGTQLPAKRDTAPNFRPMSIVANGRPSQLLLSTCVVLLYDPVTLLLSCQLAQFKYCYHKCIKMFFGYPTYQSITAVLLDLKLHVPCLWSPYVIGRPYIFSSCFFMAALCNRRAIIFLPCSFFPSSIFFFFFLA